MRLLARYPFSLAIVLAAVAATAGVFLFEHVQNRQPNQRVVSLAHVRYYSPAQVRQAFARHGITLRYTSTALPGLWLSNTPLPVPTAGLYVMLAGKKGTVSWGPKTGSEYDQPIGNIDVHYGGGDAHVLDAVSAAVSELR
jgi:hypothetical protein